MFAKLNIEKEMKSLNAFSRSTTIISFQGHIADLCSDKLRQSHLCGRVSGAEVYRVPVYEEMVLWLGHIIHSSVTDHL